MASGESKPHEILILGGNFGGVNVAHYLLRNTIPALKKLDSLKDYHITIVSPSTHFYWKIGAPRALINKELIPIDTIFKPLKDAFSSHSSQVTYVQGVATAMSASGRSVTVRKSDGTPEYTITYDSLVITTGTTSKSALWTLQGDHVLSQDALRYMHGVLPNAKTILVAGGGAVGVETAGEIASAYPNARITLLSGASQLLLRAPLPATGKRAEERLKAAGIEVVHDLRVKSKDESSISSSNNNKDKTLKLALSDGSERTVDLYIDATGGTPNTSFVPADWLNEQKLVKVDADTLRVKGGAGADSAGVYALGDAADYSNQTYMWTDAAVGPLCSSLGVDVAKALGKEAESGSGQSSGLFGWLFGGGSGSGLVQKTCQPMKGTMIVPTGAKGGVGSIMGFQLPSIMVHVIKGRTYFTEQIPKMMSGELRAKA